MSIAMTGGLVGAALGLVNFFILMNVAKQMSLNTAREGPNQGARFLRWAAWADLIIFPLIGYYFAPIIVG